MIEIIEENIRLIESEVFYNSNGDDYQVLERNSYGDALLVNSKGTLYVVAWNCPEDTSDTHRLSWGQGHYFYDEESARKLWNKKYKNKKLSEDSEIQYKVNESYYDSPENLEQGYTAPLFSPKLFEVSLRSAMEQIDSDNEKIRDLARKGILSMKEEMDKQLEKFDEFNEYWNARYKEVYKQYERLQDMIPDSLREYLGESLNEASSWSRYHIVTSDGEIIDSYTDYKDAEEWVKQLYKDGDFKRGELTIVDSYEKKQNKMVEESVDNSELNTRKQNYLKDKKNLKVYFFTSTENVPFKHYVYWFVHADSEDSAREMVDKYLIINNEYSFSDIRGGTRITKKEMKQKIEKGYPYIELTPDNFVLKESILFKDSNNQLEESLNEASYDGAYDISEEQDSDEYIDDSVHVHGTFIEGGIEYEWVSAESGIYNMDFDEWQVWSARDKDSDDDSLVYFVVEIDTGFLDWGPCDTAKEAEEFLVSKYDDYQFDEEE